MIGKGREAANRVREGQEREYGTGREGKLTRISPFAASLAACGAGKAQMSGFAVVVVLVTLGDARGT